MIPETFDLRIRLCGANRIHIQNRNNYIRMRTIRFLVSFPSYPRLIMNYELESATGMSKTRVAKLGPYK